MSSEGFLDPIALRHALSSLPDPAQESLIPPPLNQIYLPKSHIKALSLDASIVVGMRGSGKSLWTAVLSNPEHQTLVEQFLLPGLHVRVGYGLDENDRWFPSERVLGTLLEQNFDPSMIWKTIVLRHALEVCQINSPLPGTWRDAITWCEKETEMVSRLFDECDQQLMTQGKPLLILFDSIGSNGP